MNKRYSKIKDKKNKKNNSIGKIMGHEM